MARCRGGKTGSETEEDRGPGGRMVGSCKVRNFPVNVERIRTLLHQEPCVQLILLRAFASPHVTPSA